MFFEFDGFDQDDLDSFADLSELPRFQPTVIGGQPGKPTGEAVMEALSASLTTESSRWSMNETTWCLISVIGAPII